MTLLKKALSLSIIFLLVIQLSRLITLHFTLTPSKYEDSENHDSFPNKSFGVSEVKYISKKNVGENSLLKNHLDDEIAKEKDHSLLRRTKKGEEINIDEVLSYSNNEFTSNEEEKQILYKRIDELKKIKLKELEKAEEERKKLNINKNLEGFDSKERDGMLRKRKKEVEKVELDKSKLKRPEKKELTLNTGSENKYHKKLEFIHITKTAGSTIERQAASSGIKWGVCHWKKVNLFGPTCTSTDKKRPTYKTTEMPFFVRLSQNCEPWHVPVHWFTKNPYNDSKTFTVVRNPYTRAISEYYSKWGGYRGPDKNDEAVMNKWVQWRMQIKTTVVAHFLPQHLYVYNLQGEKKIDHVLRFEYLDEEFNQLMKYYAINVTLGKKSTNVRKSDSLLTTTNLTQKNNTHD